MIQPNLHFKIALPTPRVWEDRREVTEFTGKPQEGLHWGTATLGDLFPCLFMMSLY